jgi:hypothetical protein
VSYKYTTQGRPLGSDEFTKQAEKLPKRDDFMKRIK